MRFRRNRRVGIRRFKLVSNLLAIFFLSAFAQAALAEPELIAKSDPSFSRPHDVVLSPDHRHLFVADLGNNRVAVLDPQSLEVIAEIGVGELTAPHDVAFDKEGQLLVADSGHDRIVIYEMSNLTGRIVGTLSGGIGSPEGVGVLSNARVAVTDTRGGGLVIFEGDRSVERVELAGGEPFRSPHDVLVLPNDEIIVADSANDRLVLLDASLNVVRIFGGTEYQFRGPRYLARAADGILYVADKDAHRVVILDPEFRIVGQIGTGEMGDGPNQLNRPEGVEVLDAKLWMADTYNNRILLYRR